METTFKLQQQPIPSAYTVFEQNQVLTARQLNSVADYLDTQDRLSRVKLSGTGIVSGLKLSVNGNTLRVSQGLAISTDGDLMYLSEDTVYDRYITLDFEVARYPLFEGAKVFELIPAGVQADKSQPLKELVGNQSAFSCVLYQEQHIHNPDKCSGVSCDNSGKQDIHKLKLILVPDKMVKPLLATIPSPAQRVSPSASIALRRTLITQAVGESTTTFNNHYIDIIRLNADAMINMGTSTAKSLAILGLSDLDNRMSQAMTAIRRNVDDHISKREYLQYIYAYLNDLAAAFNEMTAIAVTVKGGNFPATLKDLQLFPKHVLLGVISATTVNDREGTRHLFYPAPGTGSEAERLEHARFLLERFLLMAVSFQRPDAAREIRITPGNSRVQPLGSQAIPVYYELKRSGLAHFWDFRKSQNGQNNWHTGYNAADYANTGLAQFLAPLDFNIQDKTFFRIEGHLGQNIERVYDQVEKIIIDKNLPIKVYAVQIADVTTRIPPFVKARPYTDLHRLHQMFRTDLKLNLDQAQNYTATLATNMEAEKGRPDIGSAAVSSASSARQLNNTIKATTATLTLNYQQFDASAFKSNIAQATNLSGALQKMTKPITSATAKTPLDTIATTSKIYWLDWIKDLINKREDKQDDRMRLKGFMQLHNGAAHEGGAVPGGTFILVYGAQSQNVLADISLPYRIDEIFDDADDDRPLGIAQLRPDWFNFNTLVIDSKVNKNFLMDKLRDQSVDLEGRMNEKVLRPYTELVTNMGVTYKDFVIKTVTEFPRPKTTKDLVVDPGKGFTTDKYRAVEDDIRFYDEALSRLNAKEKIPGTILTTNEKALKAQAEAGLAESITILSRSLAATGMREIVSGTEEAAIYDIAKAAVGKIGTLATSQLALKNLGTFNRKM